MKRAVFIERDSVINKVGAWQDGTRDCPILPEDFHLQYSVTGILERLKAQDLLIIVIAYQSMCLPGDDSELQIMAVHTEILKTFPVVSGIFACFHRTNDNCKCYSPRPGLVVSAASRYNIDLSASYIVSNRWQEMEMARKVDAMGLAIASPWLKDTHPSVIFPTMEDVGAKILELAAAT